MHRLTFFRILLLVVSVASQQRGNWQIENHPSLSWENCSGEKGCVTQNGAVTMDANWRWIHTVGGYINCYTSGNWISKDGYNNLTICPDDETCSANCALDGTYYPTMGVKTNGSSVDLKFTNWDNYAVNTGPRLFLMADDTHYQMFNLLNKELSFDVDVSTLPCGINAALYFVSMDADGGMSRYPDNKVGAQYGTGYCDAQCPRYLHYINGKANVNNWTPFQVSSSDDGANTGFANRGSCCAEFDVFKANSISSTFKAHTCKPARQAQCTGNACGGADAGRDNWIGTCDPDGCDFNPYRMGNTSFYGPGPGSTVDTTRPFTVVTQFLTSDGTSAGNLSEIKRHYIQNGIKVSNPSSNIPGITGSSIMTEYCKTQKSIFGERDSFEIHGGMDGMSEAMENGMAMVFNIWYDKYYDNLPLDGTFPVGDSARIGAVRGPCQAKSPSDLENDNRRAFVDFSRIRVGDIGSTG